MKYTIVGSGPTGLSLAYILATNNYSIDLIEQDNILGGSWNSNWVQNKYFSENAPRVLGDSGSHIDFLHDIGMTDKDFQNIYGNIFQSNIKIFEFIKNYFEYRDYYIFLMGTIKYKFKKENLLLSDWLSISNMSEKSKQAIKIIAVTINDIPEKTNVNDFFGSIGAVGLIQMKEPNKWHILIEDILKKMPHVNIYKNMKVLKINTKNKYVRSVTCMNLLNSKHETFTSNTLVLCTQSSGILNIIKKSNSDIKNNWGSYKWLKKWSDQTFYSGYGFQLHFTLPIEFPNKWCWSCKSQWNIIILPVSDWLKIISKDPTIKTVWSCCIIDMDVKSARINKTANQCTKSELLEECVHQIRSLYKSLPYPDAVTVSKGIYRKNNKWISNNTGFTRGKLGYLPMKGEINNLFALGCFTEGDSYSISYMKTAINATIKYLNIHEPNLDGFYKSKNINKSNIIKILVLIVLIIYLLYFGIRI